MAGWEKDQPQDTPPPPAMPCRIHPHNHHHQHQHQLTQTFLPSAIPSVHTSRFVRDTSRERAMTAEASGGHLYTSSCSSHLISWHAIDYHPYNTIPYMD
mmetsp:Transcript_24047/g.59451  ORF Transcript_24047/g.59451 Transcript_24047/m.59451 type:complete len:99 (-) Transcript_24047:42-338(-)